MVDIPPQGPLGDGHILVKSHTKMVLSNNVQSPYVSAYFYTCKGSHVGANLLQHQKASGLFGEREHTGLDDL